MITNRSLWWTLLVIVTLSLLAGCGGNAPVVVAATATQPPVLAGPVASGEWIATTDFGKLVFTVDATGTKITKMSYQFSAWTCGPTTNSGTIEIGSEWPITDGKFAVRTTFDPDGKQVMNFGGTYDVSNQKFVGAFDEDSYGTKCSGKWEAVAPK